MDNGDDVPFPVTLIVGVGLIGGSLGLALKQNRLTARVVGTDPDPEARAAAQEMGVVDETVADLQNAVPAADLIVLCAPPRQIASMLPEVLRGAKPEALVTDVGSAKAHIAQAAGTARGFVGGHPMAGSEQGGVRHARADLFEEATWAVCPTSFSSQEHVKLLQTLGTGVGASPLTLDAETHDAMVAVTSHLPHVLAAALMAQAGAARGRFQTCPGFRQGAARRHPGRRFLPTLWRDVCVSNRAALRDALRVFRTRLEGLESALDAEDSAAVEAFFQEGQSARRSWHSS